MAAPLTIFSTIPANGYLGKKPWQRRPGTFGDRKVPARLDITGNVDAGKLLIGTATGLLNMLENNQRVQQQWSTKKYANGVVIQCYSSPTIKHISIHVPLQGEHVPQRVYKKLCYCNCHLAIGKIINLKYGCYDFMDKLTTYDVEVCNKGNPYHYTLISGVRPMQMIPFVNEQMVLMMFEPDSIADPYIPGALQGCEMIRCRITHLDHSEAEFYRREALFNG